MWSKKGLLELLKSFGRLIWFALLGIVLTLLGAFVTSENLIKMAWTIPATDLVIPVGVYIAALVTLVIKALDSYIHNSDKTKSNGLALPFLQK